MGLVRPYPPLGLCWAWGRPVPGIPEPALKEAAGQAGSSAPQPWCLPTTLSLSVGKCNGAAGSADLPGGVVAPGRYAGLGALGRGRWDWPSPEGGSGVCGLTGARIQILAASLGLGSPGWVTWAGLASVVLWRLWLSRGWAVAS